MTRMTQQIADMVDMLPEQDQQLAFELVKKLVLAWDPDFTQTTPREASQLACAEAELAAGDYVLDHAINWS